MTDDTMANRNIGPKASIHFDKERRTATEWCEAMGYTFEDVLSFSDEISVPVKDVILKLLGYVYNGENCTYSIKNRRKPVNLDNQRFGRLKVLSTDKRRCYCECDCGTVLWVNARELLNNDVKSCGCRKRENQSYYVQSHKNGNRPDCMQLSYKGKKMTITEWARQPELISLGIKRRNIYCRLRRGWSIERTLTTPSKNLQ